MPKEVIHGERHFTVEKADSVAECVAEPVVELRWDRDAGTVSLVTKERNHEVFVPSTVTMVGGEVYQGTGSGPPEPTPAPYGYNVDLGRSAINDLIRKLRRARDSAFGPDA